MKISRFQGLILAILLVLPLATALDELVLITERHNVYFGTDNALSYVAEKVPKVSAPERGDFDFSETEYFNFTSTSLDKINIYYKGRRTSLYFSEVDFSKMTIEASHLEEKIEVKVGQPFLLKLTEGTDVVMLIKEVHDNQDRYRKYGLKDFYLEVLVKEIVVDEFKIEEPAPIEENTTAEPEVKLPKSGKIMITAESSVQRPVSIIIGSIIIGAIIVALLGLYLGLKRIA